jgi:hypothetical protein
MAHQRQLLLLLLLLVSLQHPLGQLLLLLGLNQLPLLLLLLLDRRPQWETRVLQASPHHH